MSVVYTVAPLDSVTRRIEAFRPTAAKKQSCRPIFITLGRRAACNESNKLPIRASVRCSIAHSCQSDSALKGAAFSIALSFHIAARDSESGLMRWGCPSVCLSVRLSPKCKNAIFSKTKQFRAIDTYRKSYVGFSKNPILDP